MLQSLKRGKDRKAKKYLFIAELINLTVYFIELNVKHFEEPHTAQGIEFAFQEITPLLNIKR